MSEYNDVYEEEYICPKCKNSMESVWNDENVDDYNFDGKTLVCEVCGLEMPKEAYGFSSRKEYESWYDTAYERVYHDPNED